MRIEIKAYAKINLNLKILNKLPNDYHEISSMFQAVDLYDVLTISKEKKGFHLTGSVVCPLKENLITKAKKALETFVKKKLPCKIHLIKNIPISAGLGGGSSDASATLIGLNKLYKLDLNLQQLTKISLGVGSDVPFFVSNTGTALVEGIGEKIKPSRIKVSKVYVLARPHKRINTSQMYQDYDKTGKSFFELVQEICPSIKEIYSHFHPISNECGMSGSGPTMFAGFDSYDKAVESVESFGIKKFDGDFYICKSSTKTYDTLQGQESD